MDNKSWIGVEKGVVSVINQGDEMFFNRIISRNPSVGCSSRIYYSRSSEGIPFDWEMQPGTPKEPRKEDIIILPPISPPPAVLSLGLPKPCIKIEEPKQYSMKLRFKFWKQGKKKHGTKKLDNLDVIELDKYSNYEMCSSDDGEFMGSSRFSSSSSSLSFSFSNGFSFRSSRLASPSRQDSSLHRKYHGCSPLNFSSILVRVSRSRQI